MLALIPIEIGPLATSQAAISVIKINNNNNLKNSKFNGGGRRSGLMGSALDFGARRLLLRTGQGLCVVFLGKTPYCHSASLLSGV